MPSDEIMASASDRSEEGLEKEPRPEPIPVKAVSIHSTDSGYSMGTARNLEAVLPRGIDGIL